MIKYEFFADGKILISKYIGDIDRSAIESYLQFMLTMPESKNLVKTIADYRDANLKINLNDLKEILKVKQAFDTTLTQKTTVFLVNKPNETAFTSLISTMYNKELIHADYCSTLEGCIKASSLDIDKAELARRLENLKNEF